MKIKRTRYIIMRNDRTEIWCGVSKHFYFKNISEIGNASIKTYESESRAKASCSSRNKDFEVVKIIEIIETLESKEIDDDILIER